MAEASVPQRSVLLVDAEAVRAERMDAALRTAGALAHEVANYLGAVRTMAYLLNDEIPADSAAKEDLDVIVQTMDGAAQLVQDLRAFAHPKLLGEEPADLNAVLREAELQLRALVKPGARLDLALAGRPLWVLGHPERLRGLATELVVRASEDVGDGGRIVVETSEERGEAGALARLVVRDDGRGLGPEQAARAFEPFVASRSHRTGLILSTVYVVVTRSGGAVAAESAPGEGTAIRVDLPLQSPPGGGEGGAA